MTQSNQQKNASSNQQEQNQKYQPDVRAGKNLEEKDNARSASDKSETENKWQDKSKSQY